MKIKDIRFWQNVNVTLDDGCWEWKLSLLQTGYGQVRRGGKNYSTHRYAYRLEHGDIPDGMCVLHKCDNRKCCRPDHLFIGTHQDNHDDMVAKGRKRWKAPVGSQNGNAKLKECDVLAIKGSLSVGAKGTDLAERFGVSPSTISIIKKGKWWRHV
jgi:hypothetical protein